MNASVKVGQSIPTSCLPVEIVRDGGGWLNGTSESVYVLRDVRTGQFVVREVRGSAAWTRRDA